jgi:hypothetical protein
MSAMAKWRWLLLVLMLCTKLKKKKKDNRCLCLSCETWSSRQQKQHTQSLLINIDSALWIFSTTKIAEVNLYWWISESWTTKIAEGNLCCWISDSALWMIYYAQYCSRNSGSERLKASRVDSDEGSASPIQQLNVSCQHHVPPQCSVSTWWPALHLPELRHMFPSMT